MGSCEETKACKPEKSSSPPSEHQQQASVHAYPDWAAMQAYYGPRMAVPPPPYMASGHPPPPYMWAPPQHMMPPYAAMYPHGGLYPHPGVPLVSPMSIDSPAKSSGNSDRGLMKKLKGFDGLAMSIGNGNGESAVNGISNSGETEGSSEGSDGNTSGKRSREESPAPHGDSKKVTALTVTLPKVSGKTEAVIFGNPISDSELKKSPVMTSATVAMMPNDALLQNERELKRERRKQSNRESARRSRLRKQAEAEELAIKVDALSSENLTLKSEINRLTDNAEKLKLQNAKLIEKLKNAQEENETEEPSTANLLSRVDSGSDARNDGNEEVYKSNNSQKSGAKLRQLLDASPRADAVAAS